MNIDLLGFVQSTQEAQWEKYCKLYPQDTEKTFCKRVVAQLSKADLNASPKAMQAYGTLGVLRHGVRDRGTRFKLCQFKPEHELNPDTLARYQQNRLRVVPELAYSPWTQHDESQPERAKKHSGRIDLVLFVNGLPVATLELKSEFKQSVQQAIQQYKAARLPADPSTRKAEPLLSFKRGALVHFAVSQYEVYMSTRLQGKETVFLPFNKGTGEGGAGNDTPEDPKRYAADYLWREVLQPDAFLNILGHFIHLKIEEREDAEGRRYQKETLIFPRYHQWDVVHRLLGIVREEGPGHKYLIQHSAGSGKSNSIAWTAHQLASLYDAAGEKLFHSVIVLTDRTVLDAQLQETISQFEQVNGLVVRINLKEGEGAKSQKLATALENEQSIIIVTLQTFPFVLQTLSDQASLRERRYAIIADEAHSSQTGMTARQLKEVLALEAPTEDEELSTDAMLDAIVASRGASPNLSYFAFTATPKTKTLELFGRLPKPDEVPSQSNKPAAFHVYSMRQAIEEGFILDVLTNYTNYEVAYQLALKIQECDEEVESRKATVKLNQWVRLHPYNISQKVKVIVEHFREKVMRRLNGQAKAMVATGSRKEAVRYKQQLDQYIAEKGYTIRSLVAFSGEVKEDFGERTFTEGNMNRHLKGRDISRAFDSEDYQVLIVADKFQTGFDQPKLSALYLDKKLSGVACVQTLSRLNRVYPGKTANDVFVIDFCNRPADILEAFRPYYKTAELADVSDPNRIFDLFDKLRATDVFRWHEVEQFCKEALQKRPNPAKIANSCKPAVERWRIFYREAVEGYQGAKQELDRFKREGANAALIENAKKSLKEAKKEKDTLDIFKKDLEAFVRFYEFMSQIVDYDDKDLEKLSWYARHLRPMLRESLIREASIDLDNVVLSGYRIAEMDSGPMNLEEEAVEYQLTPGKDLGTAKPQDRKEAFLSEIIRRLNELFDMDGQSDTDSVNYAYTIRDKVKENEKVMKQMVSNPAERAILGEFPKAITQAVLASSEAHDNRKRQLLSDRSKLKAFTEMIFDLLKEAV